jgi:hypothetical protein
MRPRIPIFTVRAALRWFQGAKENESTSSGSPPAPPHDDPAVLFWQESWNRPVEEISQRLIDACRQHWLSRTLLANTHDLFRASAITLPPRQFLCSFLSDDAGSEARGGRFYRSTFDPRIQMASVTHSASPRPNSQSFRFGKSLQASLDEVTRTFGPLEFFQIGHNDDDTVFQPVDSRLEPTRIAFYLNGGWKELPNGNYLHRLRFSAETHEVPRAEAIPEWTEISWRADS